MAAEIINVTTEEQLREALDIRKEVFVIEQKVPLDIEIDELDSLDADAHHILIKYEGEYAATGRVTYYNKDSAKMQRIAVRKPFRSKGLGRVLLMAMETQARELKLLHSVLDAQCQAEAFYSKLGYVTTSDEPFDDAGIPHVRMKKQLQ
ncbi:Predicted N-acyltransferase, GNAT family [Paenibacillus uliginis N3/975]|uniref:Predicted N-acyltransferase, GNAT family n=1 Tax=Paenibacillus uliginis N3/975 TaxID=1313296 RepID=A0A1X7HJX2_9BACL|nr:GNAT family N-acetyltransferase [Paenibacillus uliginis]SMF88040.1 Predicted N-acyltransferase, GNAT family [Paenibacillus uliginis N3/975]